MQEVIAVFSADQVARLTGVSLRQLSYWDRTGFFSPRIVDDARRPFGRIYAFRDVVGLRVIGYLRNEHAPRVPLTQLRRVGAWLHARYSDPWATLRFRVSADGEVFFVEPRSKRTMRAHKQPGQVVDPHLIKMETIAAGVRRDVEDLRRRTSNQIGVIERNRNVARNAHVLAGTRIPTRAIWNFHVAGYRPAQIIAEYPRLTRRDVSAAIEFEAQRSRRKIAS